MLTQEILKHYITYDPITGFFYSNGVQYSNKSKGERVGTLHKTKGYRYICIKGKTYREQRVAFLYMTGNWPTNQVDHINQVKDDNRWDNLRDIPASENCWNRPVYKTNKSGYTGVVWNKQMNKWQVLCRRKGKQTYLGMFDNVDEAGDVARKFYEENR